jgi:peptidoglycan/LPS O-acetylase OafA/YrhL
MSSAGPVSSITNNPKYSYLDWARGLSAVVVLCHHLRNFVFVDYHEAYDVGPLWQLFYFVTGLGHQAVVVFFVLSGFLIGGNVAQLVDSKRWSWPQYAVRRLTRLWIVLIPALVLTALFDTAGRYLTDSPFYSGALFDTYHSGPTAYTAPASYSVATFVWNVLFLQTVVAPTFGTNAALWSLANEFWYYVLFPLMFLALQPSERLGTRGMLAIGITLLCIFLPTDLLAAGLIWLLGYGAWLVSARVSFSSRMLRLLTVVLLGLFLGALALSRFKAMTGYSDFVVGLTFALLLVPLTHTEVRNQTLRSFSEWLSGLSYTLYLVHLPIAAFVAAWLLETKRFAPGANASLVFGAMFLRIIVYTWIIHHAFERHTPSMQKWLLGQLAFFKHKYSSPSAQRSA